MNKMVLEGREVLLFKLPENKNSNVQTDVMYYYGTSVNPMLFSSISDLIDFLKKIKEIFKFIDFEFGDSIVRNGKTLQTVKLLDNNVDNFNFVNLYCIVDHICSITILPDVICKYIEEKDAK